ncbi:MAG: hypothetical protein ACFFBD_21395, partial [Candidatus Hodarchaeota archaeon]
ITGTSPLKNSNSYSMIMTGFIFVLLLFGGAFIGISLRKIIGCILCLFGVILDLVVRIIAITDLVAVVENPHILTFYTTGLGFDFLDFLLISIFFVCSILEIRIRLNYRRKIRRKKVCKNCNKYMRNSTSGFCPHCGYLISS